MAFLDFLTTKVHLQHVTEMLKNEMLCKKESMIKSWDLHGAEIRLNYQLTMRIFSINK